MSNDLNAPLSNNPDSVPFVGPIRSDVLNTTEPNPLGFDPKALSLTIGAFLTNVVSVLVLLKIVPTDAATGINSAITAVLGALVVIAGNVTLLIRFFKHSENKADTALRMNALRTYQQRTWTTGTTDADDKLFRAILKQ